MSDNNKHPSPKQALLGELESIKSILDSNSDEFDDSLSDELLDIPILDDVVPELSSNSHTSGLLDLDNIFGDLDGDILDKHQADDTDSQPAESSNTADTISSATIQPSSLALDPSRPEQEQEQEASLQLDHLDANISFPAFTLDAAAQENTIEPETHNAQDNIPTLEAHPGDNSDTQTIVNTPCEIDQALQQTLNEYVNNEAGTPPPQLDERFNDESSYTGDTANPLENLMSDFRHLQSQAPVEQQTTQTTAATSTNAAYDLDLMIQELVDEFIPPIEAELRKRLSECSPTVIIELAKKHLDN